MILILSTFSNKEEARKIGKGLLEQKLIACYNLLPVESSYWWKKKIVDEKEILMIMKTNKNFADVEKFIIKHHSYNTPEIVAIKPKQVSKKYLKWVEEVTE